jgi:3-(3-hydroxy-phenyl)propionate hydroxylase
MMLAGELRLAGVDVAIVERRASAELIGSRAGGLHARTIEVLDQRGIAGRFLAQGKVMQVAAFAHVPLDISDFPTRHNYGLALRQKHFERILAGWIEELAIPIYRGREVTGFAQDDTGSTSSFPTASRCGPIISSGATADAAWSVKQPASHSPGGIRRSAT